MRFEGRFVQRDNQEGINTNAHRCEDALAGLTLEVAFDGSRLASEGGLTWLAEAEKEFGL